MDMATTQEPNANLTGKQEHARSSVIFFTIFFLAILGSVILTYYKIEIRHEYSTYTSEDEVPEPLDFYRAVLDVVLPSSNSIE